MTVGCGDKNWTLEAQDFHSLLLKIQYYKGIVTNYISPHWTTLVYLWLQAAEAVASKMHFSYAGITCYYAILVWESLAANSDRAKTRASSRSRQPFKGQLNASLAQGGSPKALKNNFFFALAKSTKWLCLCRSLLCNSKRIFSFRLLLTFSTPSLQLAQRFWLDIFDEAPRCRKKKKDFPEECFAILHNIWR